MEFYLKNENCYVNTIKTTGNNRPKTTWRRTVMAELSEVKLTWGEAKHAAQNRAKWKEMLLPYVPQKMKRSKEQETIVRFLLLRFGNVY